MKNAVEHAGPAGEIAAQSGCRSLHVESGVQVDEVRLIGAEAVLAQDAGCISFHQVMAQNCSNSTCPWRTKMIYFTIGCLIVLGQLFTGASVVLGIANGTCSELKPDCSHGFWCRITSQAHRTGRCQPCGEDKVHFNLTLICKDLSARTSYKAGDLEFIGRDYPPEDLATMCHACFTAQGVPKHSMYAETEGAMMISGFDWVVLFFCLSLVTMVILGEIQDVKMCSLVRRRAGFTANWHLALMFVEDMRVAATIPLVLALLCTLIATRGADTLSLCLNMVAVILIFDINKYVYLYGLPRREQLRAQKHHLAISDIDDWELSVSKLIYFLLINGGVWGGLMVIRSFREKSSGWGVGLLFLLFPPCVFLLEAVFGLHGTCMQACFVFFRRALGVFVSIVCIVALATVQDAFYE
jgi:hypothetical protein